MIYVWAVEQDPLSKRAMPQEEQTQTEAAGKDVFVPWKLAPTSKDESAQTFQRYYHMFAQGELSRIACEAAQGIGLHVGSRADNVQARRKGVQIVQDGWERSNYFVELQRWSH